MHQSGAHMNVVINFHKGDQASARLLLELLMSVEEGVECAYYLQYGENVATLKISETLLKFLNRKKAYFSNELPDIRIPKEMIANDPNNQKFEGTHTVRSKMQKLKHLQWNLCVFKYIQQLDSFLMVEPDSVVLKHGWLKDIYDVWKDSGSAIFGHLKKGLIKGEYVATHWAGSSVYDSLQLRKLDLEKYFYERYPSPWWPLRNEQDTEAANNCFWGPVFSGYDVSYDYFLFGLHWYKMTGLNDPRAWPVQGLPSREDLILCDFNSKKTTEEIVSGFLGKLPLLHGVKGDGAREKVLKHFLESGIDTSSPYILSGLASDDGLKKDSLFFNIGDLKSRFQGETCVIIGNGPSLKKTDMRLLKNHYTIGLNRIYLNYPNMGFQPTFYCVVNPHVIEQFAPEIDRLGSIRFIRKESQSLVKNRWNTFFVDSLQEHSFNKNFESLSWYEGWTVTYCAMQVAYYLGFKTVVLIGVDHYFKESGEPNKLVEEVADDTNHFHPDYFGKGIKWQYPDLYHSEKSYRIAKRVFEDDGRTILDATIDGKLDVFQKVDYTSYFTDKNPAPPAGVLNKLGAIFSNKAAWRRKY